MNPKTNTKAEYETIQKAIKDSALQDWKDWVNTQVKAMEEANACNNSRKTYSSSKACGSDERNNRIREPLPL